MEICRICLEPEHAKNLISPCNCIGSQRYVHHACLNKWQETMINNILTYPEIYSKSSYNICSVCKSPNKIPVSSRSRLWLTLVFPVLRLIQKYFFTLGFTILILLFISGFLLITLFFNIIVVVLAVILYCYWKGLRPQAFATANGVRIGLIRIGNPVTGVFPGVLLEATSRIATGIFAGSKILITAYDIHHGAVGFIINKQSFTENGEIINIGGPVSPHSCHVIHDNPNISGSQFITEGVYIGGSVNELNQNHQKSTIFGYSGWSALQLDGEIRAGVWRILQEVSPQDIFA